MDILCALITVFIVLLFARAILSWFPVQPGSALVPINELLSTLTEWALRPLRSIIPPVGMFDMSFLVLTFGLLIVQRAICG
jgi:YggT family protein